MESPTLPYLIANIPCTLNCAWSSYHSRGAHFEWFWFRVSGAVVGFGDQVNLKCVLKSFVNALMHSTNNVFFYAPAHLQKNSAYTSFYDAF